MSFWRPDPIIKEGSVQSLGASATDQVISREVSLTPQGAKNLRADIYLGEVTVTNDIVFALQGSSGYGVWEDDLVSDDTVATKSGAAFTAATTDICTDASHGLSTGDTVVVNSDDTLPAGLSADTVYYVIKINDNTFYLSTKPSSNEQDRVDITDTGTGTHSYYAVSKVSLRINAEDADDQDVVPLANRLRVVATSGVDDAAVILDVLLLQES